MNYFIIKRVYAQIIANQLVSVQPMSRPFGKPIMKKTKCVVLYYKKYYGEEEFHPKKHTIEPHEVPQLITMMNSKNYNDVVIARGILMNSNISVHYAQVIECLVKDTKTQWSVRLSRDKINTRITRFIEYDL